jgi:uncharacterized protein YlxP (DUF503 family)
MVIGICTIELEIPMAASLKDKRQVIKSLTARLRREYNVAVAEVDFHNAWHLAAIGIVTVSSDRDYAHGLLMKAVRWVEETRLDCDLVDYEIEFV